MINFLLQNALKNLVINFHKKTQRNVFSYPLMKIVGIYCLRFYIWCINYSLKEFDKLYLDQSEVHLFPNENFIIIFPFSIDENRIFNRNLLLWDSSGRRKTWNSLKKFYKILLLSLARVFFLFNAFSTILLIILSVCETSIAFVQFNAFRN